MSTLGAVPAHVSRKAATLTIVTVSVTTASVGTVVGRFVCTRKRTMLSTRHVANCTLHSISIPFSSKLCKDYFYYNSKNNSSYFEYLYHSVEL